MQLYDYCGMARQTLDTPFSLNASPGLFFFRIASPLTPSLRLNDSLLSSLISLFTTLLPLLHTAAYRGYHHHNRSTLLCYRHVTRARSFTSLPAAKRRKTERARRGTPLPRKEIGQSGSGATDHSLPPARVHNIQYRRLSRAKKSPACARGT